MDERAIEKPNAVEVEKAILGLCLIEDGLVNRLLERMTIDDFYDPKNQIIFDQIRNLTDSQKPVDIVNMAAVLENSKGFENIDIFDYLTSLSPVTYYSSNFDSYIDIVKEKAKLRKIIEISDSALREAYSQKIEASSIIGRSTEGLYKVTELDSEDGLVPLKDTINETFDHLALLYKSDDSFTGVTTGYRSLDSLLGGLQNSDFDLIAARPSVGKTALGINIAVNAAKAGHQVAIFSLEMSRRQILQRILSMISMVDLQNITSGNLTDEEWQLLIKSIPQLEELDISVDDTASISITELKAKAKRKKQEEGLDLIVIDYLQLMTSDSKRIENRQQEISNISRGLKALAKELNVPVLSLSQLSRKPEERSDKTPVLSDLRESGAIEQDADVVMMLYREDYYDQDTEEQNIMHVSIAKHRNGPTGTVKLYFKKETTSFYDLAHESDDYETEG